MTTKVSRKIIRIDEEVKSLSMVHVEVPCCFGLVHMAQQAINLSGKNIPFREVTVGVNGNSKPRNLAILEI